jgi:hypothetical protein
VSVDGGSQKGYWSMSANWFDQQGTIIGSDFTRTSLRVNSAYDVAKWLRIGEAEHYDYLVHASSGKVLALSDDGRLILDDRSKHNDADMRSSRAFWNIKEIF